jgi:hypothetical protein
LWAASIAVKHKTALYIQNKQDESINKRLKINNFKKQAFFCIYKINQNGHDKSYFSYPPLIAK